MNIPTYSTKSKLILLRKSGSVQDKYRKFNEIEMIKNKILNEFNGISNHSMKYKTQLKIEVIRLLMDQNRDGAEVEEPRESTFLSRFYFSQLCITCAAYI